MAILRGQRSGNDCGPTCFANALNILGYNITITQANELCHLKPEGTYSSDLSRAFERYGFDVKEKSYKDADKAWAWAKKATDNGTPIILAVDNDSHWILVLRAGDEEMQVLDPDEETPFKTSKKEMLKRWLCGDKSEVVYYGLELIPVKLKSTKAVYVRKRLLSTSDVK